MYCSIQKDCSCNNITEVNSTVINSDVAYIGVNNTYVNSSITNVGKWDAEKIKLICKGIFIYRQKLHNLYLLCMPEA